MSTYDEMRRSRRRRHPRENDGRDTSCRLHAPTYVCQRCDLRDNVNSLVKGPAERNCRNEEKREGKKKKERERAQGRNERKKGGRGERNTSVYDRYICKRDACTTVYMYIVHRIHIRRYVCGTVRVRPYTRCNGHVLFRLTLVQCLARG